MEICRPSHLTPEESKAYAHAAQNLVPRVVLDDLSREYVNVLIREYRAVTERLFPKVAGHIQVYRRYPYLNIIVRFANAVCISLAISNCWRWFAARNAVRAPKIFWKTSWTRRCWLSESDYTVCVQDRERNWYDFFNETSVASV